MTRDLVMHFQSEPRARKAAALILALHTDATLHIHHYPDAFSPFTLGFHPAPDGRAPRVTIHGPEAKVVQLLRAA